MRRLASILLMFALTAGAVVLPASASATYSFGSTPKSEAWSKANYWVNQLDPNHQVAGLTANRITAMMIAISIAELGATDDAPSPMTQSRWDPGDRLYEGGSYNPPITFLRDYWSPGIGLWQIDSAGFASDLSTDAAIYVPAAADAVAKQLVDKWIKYGNLTDTWSDWYACRTGDCTTVYNAIYRVIRSPT